MSTVDDLDAGQELAAFRDGYLQLAWDQHTDQSLHHLSYTYWQDEVVHVHLAYEGRPAVACQGCARLTLVADVDTDTDEMPCRNCGTVGDWSWVFAPDRCTDDTHSN